MQSGTGVADKRVDITYDAASQMRSVTRTSDLAGTQLVAASTYAFDLAGRLTNLTHAKNVTTLAQYSWVFDDANRITRMTSNDGTTNYTYDDTNQLTAADHSFQTDETFSYDLNGNRANPGYQTGINNRLTSDGTFNYTYDAEGNRTRRTNIATGEVTTYQWDYRNRLTQVTTKNAAGTVIMQATYTYDVYDRRIAKIVDSDGAGPNAAQTERFVYAGVHIALTFDSAGTQTHRYLHGPAIDQILADENAVGSILWPLTDNLGTVRDLVDSTGTVRDHIKYDSFGRITDETNVAIDHLFAYTGREFDSETGVQYNRARYYDAGIGLYLSEDPVGFSAHDLNLARYALGDPVSKTDPSGNVAALISIPVAIALGVFAWWYGDSFWAQFSDWWYSVEAPDQLKVEILRIHTEIQRETQAPLGVGLLASGAACGNYADKFAEKFNALPPDKRMGFHATFREGGAALPGAVGPAHTWPVLTNKDNTEQITLEIYLFQAPTEAGTGANSSGAGTGANSGSNSNSSGAGPNYPNSDTNTNSNFAPSGNTNSHSR